MPSDAVPSDSVPLPRVQLTVRAAVTGIVLGGLLCLSNLYVVLKTGWSLGVTLTASLAAFAVFGGLGQLKLLRRPFSALENNAMSSVASAAGYMTGGGNMAAWPALLMFGATGPSAGWMILWFATLAALGVFAAIPLKKQLIDDEQLAFPTGTATAETIRTLHTKGNRRATRGLVSGLLLGALTAWLREGPARAVPFRVPSTWGLPFTWAGLPAARWTLSLDTSLLLLGAGALMSFRTGWSMLAGALLNDGLLAPWLVARGLVKSASYREIVAWSTWPAAGLLVASGLASLATGSARKGLRQALSRALASRHAPFQKTGPLTSGDAPRDDAWATRWFLRGFVVLGPLAVFLMSSLFGIPWWLGALTLPLCLLLAYVAARVTGETDTTPTKALGPLAQLVYGAALPGNVVANLMGANVVGGIGLHAADLLTDLKAGALLGARPRQQVVAQLLGVMAGALLVVPAFAHLIPDTAQLGTERWPAPGPLVWGSVAETLAHGWQALPRGTGLAVAVGALAGLVLSWLERALPPRWARFVPSPTGVGIALVVPAYNSFSFFLGSAGAAWWRGRQKRRAQLDTALAQEDVLTPAASGLIAGESLVGVLLAWLA